MTALLESTLDLAKPTQGMYPRVPSDLYHGALDAASCGRLKNLYKKSPAHCKYMIDHPKAPTPAMKKGAALHSSILEPDLFAEQYAVQPDFGDCRRTENKQRRDQWQVENKGKTFLEPDVSESIRGMTAALRSHKLAYEMICEPGYTEATFVWTDPETGQLMKSRTDRYLIRPRIIDIKSTSDASESGFARQAANLLYDLQAAMYIEGVSYVTGEVGLEFYFIAVESDPPYGVQVFKASKAMIAEGRRKYRSLLEQYAECHQKNDWPSYPAEVQALELPDWAMGEDGEEITLGGVAIL